MLAAIAVVQDETGLSDRAVGIAIAKDPRWVHDMRSGRAPSERTFLHYIEACIRLEGAGHRGRAFEP